MRPILLVSEFLPPDPGGIQRSLELLFPAWGDDLEIISPVAQKKFPGLRRSLFSGSVRPRWLWLLREFWQRAAHGRRLIVFGHYSAAVTAAWLLRPFGVRYVVLCHGHDVLSEFPRRGRAMVSRHLRGAEWLGVNSTWLLEKLHGVGVPFAKLVLTHPAVADSELQSLPDHRTDGMMLSIARLVPRKNISTILRAVASLHQEFPSLQYHIIGDGPEREPLQKLAGSLGITDHVVWHGRATDNERRELLQRAQLFVLVPMVLEGGADIEGLGAVYLEAAAAGLPIVASGLGGVPDAVKHGQTGKLVSPDDVVQVTAAIREYLLSPQHRAEAGEAGRELMRHEFVASRRTDRAMLMTQGWSVETQPLISIIIPAYNAAATLRLTLESVWAQTWKNLEVIVVDDGSTDDLATALQPYRDRVTLLRQANAGAPAARNRGAAAASGRWWLFLDADTILRPDMLMSMAIALQTHPDVAYVYSDFRFGHKNFHLHEYSESALRRMNYIHTSSLVRPSLFPGFDPELKRFQDWDVWLTMAARGQQGLWLPQRLFRVQDGGVMSRWVPSVVYRLPLIGRGVGSKNIQKYRAAEAIIRAKHQLK